MKHNKDRHHVCHLCDSSYKRKAELNLHIQNMHNDLNMYDCLSCKTSFETKSSLKKHCFDNHINMVTTCRECGVTLTTPFSMYTHCLLHAGNKHNTHNCDVCGKRFKSKSLLRQHSFVHRPKDSLYKQCPVCSKTLHSRSQYYLHVKEHRNGDSEEATLKLKCEDCGASFRHASSLKRHRIHHNSCNSTTTSQEPNPYLDMEEDSLPPLCCKKCRKLYSSKSGYYEHIKCCVSGVVSNESCPHCGKCYSTRRGLTRHVQSKHPTNV